ncbi:Protein CBG04881 [Caenorhabditis briggsae]|uniref:Protein CBG04856 n=1 Tax=Caenorhabditis briggsae TaxID=6238 RepID=G2J6G4_CAEBR|nr:Protein CBG04856 [Caenorhabditis briggsae]XP_002638049.1 Protein CBG04881 [Caenorhabditis briggsae]CAP25486.1 Protein CBG04856 [Caenorhabditis briggsae]CAP25508.1 Protein CBG04881 [Caenorhabditis briggsae]
MRNWRKRILKIRCQSKKNYTNAEFILKTVLFFLIFYGCFVSFGMLIYADDFNNPREEFFIKSAMFYLPLRIRTGEEIAKKAEELAADKFRDGDYNILLRNCQHFVSLCATGVEFAII